MPYALCPMPYALCPVVPHMRARKAISPAALAIAAGIKIVPKHKISHKITLRACCKRWLRENLPCKPSKLIMAVLTTVN